LFEYIIEKKSYSYSDFSLQTNPCNPNSNLKLPKIDDRPEVYPADKIKTMDRATSVTSTIARTVIADPVIDKLNKRNENSLRTFTELTRNSRRVIEAVRERDELVLGVCMDRSLNNNMFDSTSELLTKNLRNGLILPQDRDRAEILKQMKAKIDKKKKEKAAKEKDKLEKIRLLQKKKRLSAS
jgi:hypothetical protein